MPMACITAVMHRLDLAICKRCGAMLKRLVGGYSRRPWPLLRVDFVIGMGAVVILITFAGGERMLGGLGRFSPASRRWVGGSQP